MVAGRRSGSPSPSPPCSGWISGPVSWPATARSPHPWPAGSPPTRPAPGGGWSSTARADARLQQRQLPAPADLARYVIARDQLCTFPGCRRSGWRCDLDHREPFPAGTTCAGNLHPLCRRHHLLKHHGDWTVARFEDDGATEWTSPTGHPYRSRPPAYPVPSQAPDTQAEPTDTGPPDTAPQLPDPDEPPPF
jgi:hypothetical protein